MYLAEYRSWNTTIFAKSLNQTLAIQTYDDSFNKIRTQETIQLMLAKHLINHPREYAQFYHSFTRIIFRPKMSIICKANKVSSFTSKNHHYSIQLRTGGNTSNSHEIAVFLPQRKWNQAVRFIQQSIKDHDNCSIYISTDSDQLLQYTINHLISQCSINYMKEYQRGHSSAGYGGKGHNDFMEGAMYELIVLSRAGSIIVTPNSSFGRFAVDLCQCKSSLIRV